MTCVVHLAGPITQVQANCPASGTLDTVRMVWVLLVTTWLFAIRLLRISTDKPAHQDRVEVTVQIVAQALQVLLNK